jgi:hypothetical protein
MLLHRVSFPRTKSSAAAAIQLEKLLRLAGMLVGGCGVAGGEADQTGSLGNIRIKTGLQPMGKVIAGVVMLGEVVGEWSVVVGGRGCLGSLLMEQQQQQVRVMLLVLLLVLVGLLGAVGETARQQQQQQMGVLQDGQQRVVVGMQEQQLRASQVAMVLLQQQQQLRRRIRGRVRLHPLPLLPLLLLLLLLLVLQRLQGRSCIRRSQSSSGRWRRGLSCRIPLRHFWSLMLSECCCAAHSQAACLLPLRTCGMLKWGLHSLV